MFTIEKNNILSADNKFIRYLKEYKGALVSLTVRPLLETKELTAKIRIKNLPFENDITFNLIKLSLSNNTEHQGLELKFDFKQPFNSEEEQQYALEFVQKALNGIDDIMVRWLMSDGIYFLLSQDATKNMPLIIDAHYKALKNNNELPEDMTEQEIKMAIEEQLSQFYCAHLSEFEEFEPLLTIAEMTSKSGVNCNETKK